MKPIALTARNLVRPSIFIAQEEYCMKQRQHSWLRRTRDYGQKMWGHLQSSPALTPTYTFTNCSLSP